MVSINTNLSSLIAQRSFAKSTNVLNQAVERMSTGYKINHAGDNAANYSISNDMSAKLSSYEVAQDNAAMGMDMVNTAADSLSLMSTGLSRLRALCEQACNGTYGKESIDAIKTEAQAHVDEIARLYNNTEYNGTRLFGEYTNNGFMKEIEVVTPDIVVSNPEELAQAIATKTKIGISNADVLHELAVLVNSGTTCEGKTIILTEDIDLSDYQEGGGWTPIGRALDSDKTKAFKGNFDGQGHSISNLTSARNGICALFGGTSNATIKNVAIQNCNISCNSYAGALICSTYGTQIDNCYSTGTIKGANHVGGLVATVLSGTKIRNCYSTVNVEGNTDVGGITGYINSNTNSIVNSFSLGNVKGSSSVGGIAGIIRSSVGKISIKDCYSSGNVSGDTGVGGIVGLITSTAVTRPVAITNCFSDGNIDGATRVGSCVGYFSAQAQTTINDCHSYGTMTRNGSVITDEYTSTEKSPLDRTISLQVGVYGDGASQISFESKFDLIGLAGIVSSIQNSSTLEQIDKFISKISSKQTELGAVQNRLESALDSISVNIENLTSSRSTLRDADIAKESSKYIQQQILQQAAATLLATANQSPAIALQLI